MAARGFHNVSEVLHARSLIERCSAVEGIQRLADYHAGLALEALHEFDDCEAKDALKVLVQYMLENGQQRYETCLYDTPFNLVYKDATLRLAYEDASVNCVFQNRTCVCTDVRDCACVCASRPFFFPCLHFGKIVCWYTSQQITKTACEHLNPHKCFCCTISFCH